ncbi:MAG: hypothetical protein GYA55_05490, partial [SAR324 cluster bacterium]|nr:hypothetical protein [SAR324 cluster bacterium]
MYKICSIVQGTLWSLSFFDKLIMSIFASDVFVVLFLILVLGFALGRYKVKGVSLGTAGVLFSALIFGHFGFHIPKEIMEMGLLLFVYAVGLQAGPHFFRNFRRVGMHFFVVILVSIISGTIAAILVGWYLNLRADLTVGILTGALTNTPALASAIDVVTRQGLGQGSMVSVGYGIAYPFSMLGVVLLMQWLPRLLAKDLPSEEAKWKAESLQEYPSLMAKQFLITNSNCDGKTIRELNPGRMCDANISRLRRGNDIFTVKPETVLKCGDIVRAVGSLKELDLLRVLFGEETDISMDLNQNIVSVDIEVSDDSISLKTLGELHVLEKYGVIITRLRRGDVEFSPNGNTVLLLGDQLRIVGERSAVDDFINLIGRDESRLDETTMLPFLLGLLLGVAAGNIPFPLPGGMSIRLGGAGGVFLVSLGLSHYGSVGRFGFFVPQAAKNFSREFGLMLFLAGAGTIAGAQFFEVLMEQGIALFIGGAFVT